MYSGLSRKSGGSISLSNKIQGQRVLRRKALLALSTAAGLAACGIVATLTGTANAQTNSTWTTETSGDFNTPTSWTGGVLPDSTAYDAFINVTGASTPYTVSLDSPITVNQLSIGGADVTLSLTNGELTTGLLNLGDGVGGATLNAANALILANPVVLDAGNAGNEYLSGQNITFNGSFTNETPGVLPNNHFSIASSQTVTFNGPVYLTDGAGTNQSLIFSSSTASAAAAFVVNGVISDHPAGGTGVGTLVLTNDNDSGGLSTETLTLNNANTYTGGSVINGNVNIVNNLAFGTGAVTFEGGTVSVTGPGPVILSNTVSTGLSLAGTNSLVLATAQTGSSYPNASVAPELGNGFGAYSNNGTNGATLTVNNVAITPAGNTAPGSFGIGGTGVIALNGVISDGAVAGSPMYYEGTAGTVYINGSNTYTGGTLLASAGANYARATTIIDNKSAFGTGQVSMLNMILQAAVPLTGSNALANNFQFDPALNTGQTSIWIGPSSGPITINGSLTNNATDGGLATIINYSNALLTINGNVALGGPTLTSSYGTQFFSGSLDGLDNIEINGVISDGASGYSSDLYASGSHANAGVLYITNPSNTWTGGLLISTSGPALAAVNFTNHSLDSTPIIMEANEGLLQWAVGNTEDISANIENAISSDSGNAGYFDTNGNNVTFATALTNSGSTFEKDGLGTLTLTAAGNSWGTTFVEGGTLEFGANASITTTSTARLAGATFLFDAGAESEAFSSLTLGDHRQFTTEAWGEGAGAIVASTLASSSSTISFGAINRLAGDTVDFTLPTVGSFTTTDANVNIAGGQQTILGGWATVNNGSTWAVSGSGSVAGAISGLTSFSTSFTAAKDVDAQIGTSTPGTLTINSLRFNNAGAYTVADSGSGNTLTIATGGILETAGVGAHAVNINAKYLASLVSDTTQSGASTDVNDTQSDLIVLQYNTAAAMTISSVIEDGAISTGLTKSGPGTTILTGSNTYTGQTSVDGGTLEIGSGGSIAGNNVEVRSATLTVDAGGALSSNTTLMVGSMNNVDGGTVDDTGLVNFNNGAQSIAILESQGTVNLNATALTLTSVPGSTYVDGAGNQGSGFYGNITGSGSLIINETTSTSIMHLYGSVFSSLDGGPLDASTYSGGTTITSGVLSFSTINELGTGAITLNGGANSTLQWNGTIDDLSSLGINLVGSGGQLDTNGMNVTLSKGIGGGGAGALTKIGVGTLYLNGANNYTGSTTVTAGTLELQSGATLASTSVLVNVADPTAGDTILNVDAGASLNSATALTDNDFVNFNNASQTIATLDGPGTGVVNLNGTALTISNGDNGTPLAASIEGTGSVTLTGGTLTLNGGNDYYSGGTTVSSGTLIAGVNNALPTNKAVVNNSVLIVNANNAVGAITGSGNLTVGAGANTLQLAANSGRSSQTSITVAAGSTLDITNNSIVLTPTAGTQATELAYYLGLVKQGYNGGSWTGTGITSSAVAAANAVTPLYGIAVAENDGSFGTVVGLANGQIEIAEAVIGDATLSGTVNFADFVKVEGNYGLTGADWDEGDFFYTGTVNFADFVAVEANFGDTNAISAPEMAAMQSFAGTFGDTLVANPDGVGFQVVSVPEPATMGLLAIGALGLLGRRRRKV